MVGFGLTRAMGGHIGLPPGGGFSVFRPAARQPVGQCRGDSVVFLAAGAAGLNCLPLSVLPPAIRGGLAGAAYFARFGRDGGIRAGMGFGRRTVAAAAVGTGGGGRLAAAARCGIAPVGSHRFDRFPVIPPRSADGRPSENGCAGCRARLGGVFSDGLPSSAVRYRHGGRGANADPPRPARTRRTPPRHPAAVPPRYRPRRRRTADYPCTQAPRSAGRTARILRWLRHDAGAKLPHRPAMGMGRRAFRTPRRRGRSRRRQRTKLRPARRGGRYGVYRNRRPRHQRRTKTAGTLRPKPVQPSLGAGAPRQQRLVVGRIPQRRLPRLRHRLQRLRQ